MKHTLSKIYFGGQKSFIEKQGDAVWEELCSTFYPDEVFTRTDIAAMIQEKWHYAPRTSYTMACAFAAQCVAMTEGGLFTVGPRKLRFHDIDGN